MKIVALLLSLCLLSAMVSAAPPVRVKGYTRKDGTYVAPHYRSAPDKSKANNWSSAGNYNPYTGKAGTRSTEDYSTTPRIDQSLTIPTTPSTLERPSTYTIPRTPSYTSPYSRKSSSSVGDYLKPKASDRYKATTLPESNTDKFDVLKTPSRLDNQSTITVPKRTSPLYVPSYNRKDGTNVTGHLRSAPDESTLNNLTPTLDTPSLRKSRTTPMYEAPKLPEIPKLNDRTYVSPYFKKDGTLVEGHFRSSKD